MKNFPWDAVIAGILADIIAAVIFSVLGVPAFLIAPLASIVMGVVGILVAYWRCL